MSNVKIHGFSNSCLNNNRKEYFEYLSYLWSNGQMLEYLFFQTVYDHNYEDIAHPSHIQVKAICNKTQLRNLWYFMLLLLFDVDD